MNSESSDETLVLRPAFGEQASAGEGRSAEEALRRVANPPYLIGHLVFHKAV
jgi:hypothetical protein